MPPYFPYILALFAYVALGGCVLIVAAFLAIAPQTRSIAKKLAAGICGSFPGVFLFQILAAPVVLFILVLMFAGAASVRPGGAAQGILIVTFALLMFFVFGIASLAGFYTGFRLAWEFAAGRSPREFLNKDRMAGPFVRFLRRRVSLVRRIL